MSNEERIQVLERECKAYRDYIEMIIDPAAKECDPLFWAATRFAGMMVLKTAHLPSPTEETNTITAESEGEDE